jgi:hypothetical protein
MRPYFYLIVVAIFTAFITGYFALFLQGPYVLSGSDLVKIQKLKDEFVTSSRPSGILNLRYLFPTIDHLKLIDEIDEIEKNSKAEIYSGTGHCFLNSPSPLAFLKNQKAIIWDQYRCGLIKNLPEDFFQVPPFMHPAGQSYAYLAFKLKKAPGNNISWVKNNLNLFHAQELKYLVIPLKDNWEIIKDLEGYSLKAMLDYHESIFSKDYLFIKKEFLFGSPLVYYYYPKDNFVKFLKNKDYSIENYSPSKKCFARDGEICWGYSIRHVFQRINLNTIVFFICSILIIILVVFLLLTKIKEQRTEQERKKLALQVLTHEFRTPISSLILEVENIKKSFSFLTPALQESFLRVSGDVFRLQRLTEKSRNYLKLQKPEKHIDFNLMKMSSFNEWFSFIMEHYKGEVEFYPLAKDCSGELDPYWVEISLKNLIENAMAHGKSPIKVTLTRENKFINLTVEDQGVCQFETLEEMCREFSKGKNSSGSGLGLNIVKKVMKEMGGELKFKKNPTRFILEIPQMDRKEVKNG